MVRDLGSPKVEDELNKNVGQWNQTKPEEEKDGLIKENIKEAQQHQTWNQHYMSICLVFRRRHVESHDQMSLV